MKTFNLLSIFLFTVASLTAQDINNDGNTDIIWYNSDTHEVIVWGMDGSNNRISTDTLTTIDPSTRIVGVADMDKEGEYDFVLQNDTTTEVTLLYGGRDESKQLAINLGAVRAIQVADFNNDTHLDILVQDQESGETVAWILDENNDQTSTINYSDSTDANVVGSIDLNVNFQINVVETAEL